MGSGVWFHAICPNLAQFSWLHRTTTSGYNVPWRTGQPMILTMLLFAFKVITSKQFSTNKGHMSLKVCKNWCKQYHTHMIHSCFEFDTSYGKKTFWQIPLGSRVSANYFLLEAHPYLGTKGNMFYLAIWSKTLSSCWDYVSEWLTLLVWSQEVWSHVSVIMAQISRFLISPEMSQLTLSLNLIYLHIHTSYLLKWEL